MYAPRVFVSMLAVLVVFAMASYVMSGSLLSAFLQTLICAVIIQAGYFLGVIYLVHREKLQMQHRPAADRFGRLGQSQDKGVAIRGTTASNFRAGDS